MEKGDLEMSLYKQWTDFVVETVKTKGEAAFWDEYGAVESEFYKKFLGSHNTNIKGSVAELAKEYGVDEVYFVGILDGINESLINSIDLEEVVSTTEIDVVVDYEKLYFNMLDAKADYLYSLSQWDGIFSADKRKEIAKEYRSSKTVVREDKIGRNDPCPCGSGKKYKKCCGK